MIHRKTVLCSITAFLLLSSSPVFATLLGTMINGDTGAVTELSGPSETVVDPGIEFSGTDFGVGNDIWTADFFSDDTFTLSVAVQPPNGNISGGMGRQWSFSNLFWNGFPSAFITDVVLESAIGPTFAAPGIAFGPHSITITQGNLQLSQQTATETSGTFRIVTNRAVPEPATLLLLGVGLAGLGFSRRRLH